MKTTDFAFELPEHLIASDPLPDRSASRLLALTANGIEHGAFTDLTQRLGPGDLLVVNNTKVLPARLQATKETGGKAEVMLERRLADGTWRAFIKASKTPKPGAVLTVAPDFTIELLGRDGDLFHIALKAPDVGAALDAYGAMPLPPYIKRPADDGDKSRYQTVYAKNEGAVAAPTAGLHFTPELLDALKEKGVEVAEVTLHVGAGTFLPVRVDDPKEHQMHSEWCEVSEDAAAKIKNAKRVIAVGTTVVRTLESMHQALGEVGAYSGDTNIFIYPGFEWQVIDALVTNFHLPESTLIMLVSAFAGKERVLEAYKEAVAEEYRFFSYGDAMFLERLC